MEQSRRTVRHLMGLQPAAQFGVQPLGAHLQRRGPALAPAADRSTQEAGWSSQIVQADRTGFYRVNRRHGFQQDLREPRSDLRTSGELGGDVLSYHQARSVLDDLELRADDAGIGAQKQPAR